MEILQVGQRVAILKNPQEHDVEPELHDSGEIVRVGDGGARTDREIVVASEFLKGKEVTLRHFPDPVNGGEWRFFFEDPHADHGSPISDLGPTFSVVVTSR